MKVFAIIELSYQEQEKDNTRWPVNMSILITHRLWGVDYEKPMRIWHKHSCAQWQAEFGRATATERGRQNAAQLLFLNCLLQGSKNTSFSCYNVMLLPENCCSTSLFTTGYKRLTEGGQRTLIGELQAAAIGSCCVCPPEHLSALRTLYI
jgi:hypothetical protein